MRIDFLRILRHALPGLLPSGHAIVPGMTYPVIGVGESGLGIPSHIAATLIHSQVAEAVSHEEAVVIAAIADSAVEAIEDKIHPDSDRSAAVAVATTPAAPV